MKNYAYITLLGNDKYLPLTMGLYQSHLDVGDKYPFYVLAVKKDVTKPVIDFMASQGIQVILADKLDIGDKLWDASKGKKEWNVATQKLSIFLNDSQFDKLCFLDSDMKILRPLDDLFELPCPTCIQDLYITKTINGGSFIYEPSKHYWDRLMNNFNKYVVGDGKDHDQLIISKMFKEDNIFFYPDFQYIKYMNGSNGIQNKRVFHCIYYKANIWTNKPNIGVREDSTWISKEEVNYFIDYINFVKDVTNKYNLTRFVPEARTIPLNRMEEEKENNLWE